MRASRTDKGVSAIMNVISVKLHKYPNIDENGMKEKLNKVLPKDIRVFRIIELDGLFSWFELDGLFSLFELDGLFSLFEIDGLFSLF